MPVGRDFDEAEVAIETNGTLHRRERVEPHGVISDGTRFLDDPFGEHTSQTMAARAGADIQPFHFAELLRQRTEGDAPHDRAVEPRGQQTPPRRRIIAGEIA
jgi:hypothetical protein